VPLATGSDGGGSIRIPSACCGLSGMKPSLGRVPGGGAAAPGWIDLSTSGPMARRITDVTTALDVAVGPDPSDLRALPRPEASWLAALEDPHVPVRVAWAPTLGYAEVDAEVLAACERAVGVLESLGAEVTTIDTVFDEDPVGDWLTLVGVCQLRTMRPFFDHPRWDDVDPVLRAIVDGAKATTGAQVVRVATATWSPGLDLAAVLHALAERGITRLLVEGGSRVASSFVAADFADEVWLLRGPDPVGADGVAALDALPLSAITQSPGLRVRASESLGRDILTIYERA